MNNNQNSSNLSNMYGTNNGVVPNQESNNIPNQTNNMNTQSTNINNTGIVDSTNSLNNSNNQTINQNNNILKDQSNILGENLSINSESINQNLNTNSSSMNNVNNYSSSPSVSTNINQEPLSEQKKSEIIDHYINPGPGSNQTANNNTTSNDEEYLKAYIGKNYEKIINSNISIPAFFFAELYWFYRKMFLFGLILGIIRILILNSPLGLFALIINVICIFITNKVYLIDAKYKISKIKGKMYGKNSQEILNACASKGGTSIGLTVGGIAIEIVGIIIFLIVSLITGMASIFNVDFLNNLFSNVNINIIPNSSSGEESNKTFDGTLYFDVNTNITDKVAVNVPSVFEDESMDSHEYAYTYNSNPSGVFGDCSFSLSIVSNYTNAENLATGMAEYYNNNTNIINTNVNGINWYGLNYSSVYNTTAYLMELDNKVYLYKFEIGDDSDQAACNTYNEQIFNSISLK